MPQPQDGFKDFVLDQLHGLRGLTCRAMFGGFGLRCGETFFGIVHRERLYLKVTSATVGDYRKMGMKSFRVSRKQTLRSYYEVPPDVLEDADLLVEWAKRSLERA